MAIPVNETFSGAVGQTLYLGRLAPAAGLPAWRVGQAVGEFREISGTAMSNFPPSVNPLRNSGGVSAKLDAWCGLAIDTRTSTVWSLANGGHDDYHGNEVMKFLLEADTPTWVEMLASNTAAQFTVPNNAGYYTSGRPASAHSYYTQQFIEARNRAVRFGATAASTSGNSFHNVDGYNCNAVQGVNGWDAPGTYANCPVINAGQTTCKNPVTEDLFLFNANYSVHKWTQATNTWSEINSGYPPISISEAASAYDTVRNRIFLLHTNYNFHTFDPATGLFTAQTPSGAAAATVQAATKSAGMIYEPTLDAYLVRLGRATGGAVYKIDAATFAVTVFATTGGAAVPATADISGSPENVWSRWLYVPRLGGVVFFPQYSSNVWFLRTH